MRKVHVALCAWVLFAASTESHAGYRLFASHDSIWGAAKITELDPNTGAVLNSYAPPSSPNQNAGLAYDGSYLYYLPGPQPTHSTVYKLNPDTGAVVSQYDLPDNPYRCGLATMGGYLYSTSWDPNHNYIEVYNLSTGSFLKSIDFRKANPGDTSLMIDADMGELTAENRLLAVTHPIGSFLSTRIVELDPSTGVIQDRFSILDADAVKAAKGLAAIGDEVYVSLHVSQNNKQIIVYSRDGVEHRRFGISGSTGIQALAAARAVPEPASALTLAVGLATILRRRKI